MDPNYPILQPVDVGDAPNPGLLLKSVYALYASRFRQWLAITAPTSLLASVVILMADRRIHSMYRNISPFDISYHRGEVIEAMLLRFGSFFICWFLGCFALAATAAAVNGPDEDDSDASWKSDIHQPAREHFGAILMTAGLTFCLFLAGTAAAGVVELAIVRVVGWSHFSRYNQGASLIGYLVVASIVSWFGMAIPLVLSGDAGVWATLKKSVKISNGYEGFLFLLVAESTVGSYVAWYAVHYGLTFLFPLQFRSTTWYGWLVYFVSILASAAVQPPMFIGFSRLAAIRNTFSQTLSSLPEISQVH